MHRRQLLALSVLAPFALVACGDPKPGDPQSEPSAGAGAAPNFTYSPEGYDGLTIELDRPAERIAADFYSAAGLAQYGITPVAVFGFGQNESPGKSFDADGVEVVGTEMELDIEALALTEPDILVAYGNEAGDGWTWWDEKVKDQVAGLVDFVPVKLSEQSPDAMFAQYAAIAEALGKDTDAAPVAEGRRAFERARKRIRTVAEDSDSLTVLLANFSAEINYTSTSLGIAQMLSEDGLTLVGPKSPADSSWAEVSWEKISDYPADVVLVHDASADFEDNPVYRRLPAVRADQLGTWDDKRAYTYDGYATWLNELADVLEGAKKIV
ncbi:ABC transporter substrate-binding protein [Brevibacterium spongiae]|uniref:ABC transporter substrate-binding protein n=1 Tax=Brevibacterium spongiae TaxID=2909672 RepID=A0ABY5SN66_9MICO|nr:ABC transporter substrate-binding protein [Brevibacterium spongiae]UVI36015.1 ABC transporter substrate-binding protein [Brevibacterium spongiae]